MKFTDIFIKRPVLATVVSSLILLLGLKSLFNMQVRQYPEMTNTVITVTTKYAGASADLMQGFVTNPIQKAVAAANGVDYLTSISKQSVSVVTANIKLGFSPDVALTEVMAKVAQVRSELPKEVDSPVIVKETGDTVAMMYLGFSSDQLSNEQITDYVNRQILPRLAIVDGVASSDILGGRTFAMRLWLNPEKMAAYGISSEAVFQALIANNYQSAPGQTKGFFIVTNIDADTGLESASEFGEMVVKNVDDTIIRMKDISTIELASETYNSSVKMNDKQAVFVAIKNTPTANPLKVVSSIRSKLPEFEHNLPPSMKMEVCYDSTKFIQASIDEVIKTLAEASLIVIVVIFLFLGNLRAVAIPVITIPLSLIGVFTLMALMGFSVNLLTLLGMVLAIGLVVDDAIVVVENVYRHLSQGKTPVEAALIGTREICIPVISMTITLVAVYAPIGFMSGLTGALFREFAFTLAGSVVISGVIALTLSPMMCSKILNRFSMEGNYAKKVELWFETLSHSYQIILGNALNHRKKIVFSCLGMIVTSSLFFILIPKELAPTEDQGIIMTLTKAPKYANIDYMNHYSDVLSQHLSGIQEKDLTFVISGLNEATDGMGAVILKPWEERHRSAKEIMPEVQKKIWSNPGISAFAFQLPPLPGSSRGLPIQFVINSMANYEIVYQVMEDLKEAARKSGLFMIVDSDLAFNNPMVKVNINRTKSNQLGVTMKEIAQTLALMMGENYVNRFNLYGRSYPVIPMSPRSHRLEPNSINQFYVSTASDDQIPISTIASLKLVSQPNQLFQFNQINSATFQAVALPWITMGTALAFLKNYGDKILPTGFSYDFLAEARQYVKEGSALITTFVFALIIIYLILAAQFESFRDPLIVMFSVPTSIFGALLILLLGASTLNIYSQIGLVTLIGLITKHGILIVEFANKLQEEGSLPLEAVIKAASVRLRPILMTTAAMVVGLIPLILASGAGASSRFSIGVVIIAGMLIGTTLTLFVVPTFYVLISRPKGHSRID